MSLVHSYPARLISGQCVEHVTHHFYKDLGALRILFLKGQSLMHSLVTLEKPSVSSLMGLEETWWTFCIQLIKHPVHTLSGTQRCLGGAAHQDGKVHRAIHNIASPYTAEMTHEGSEEARRAFPIDRGYRRWALKPGRLLLRLAIPPVEALSLFSYNSTKYECRTL